MPINNPINNFGSSLTPIEVLNNYFASLVVPLLNSLFAILGAILLFAVGWIIAWAFKEVLLLFLSKLRIKEWLQNIGLGKYIEDFSWEENFAQILSQIVFWLVLVIFLMSSFDVLGLQIVNSFIRNVINYFPRAIAGGLILILGFVFGELSRKVLVGLLHGFDKSSARGVSLFVKWTIIIFAILASLSQWGIASELINILASGIVLFIAIAGGLAFGFGGQDLARDVLENIRRNFK